MPKKALFFR